jgi:hypothetical protein
MHNLKEYIPIIFNGGSYGSFLNYILSNINNENKLVAPFSLNGNSHNFNYSFIKLDTSNNEFFLDKTKYHSDKFICYHPKTLATQSLPDEITRIVTQSNKSILVYPSQKDMLLTMNNMYYKIGKDWFNDIDVNDKDAKERRQTNLYSNWNIGSSVQFKDIPRWIRREFLSYYYVPAWIDLYEWNLLDYYTHPKLHIITVYDLLYNFEKTIKDIAKFLNIGHIDNLLQLSKMHSKMLELQEHINKDKLCNNIFNNFINNKLVEFSGLSLIDEAWIQWKLRSIGIEIQCNNLNVFPSTVADLKKITYSN